MTKGSGIAFVWQNRPDSTLPPGHPPFFRLVPSSHPYARFWTNDGWFYGFSFACTMKLTAWVYGGVYFLFCVKWKAGAISNGMNRLECFLPAAICSRRFRMKANISLVVAVASMVFVTSAIAQTRCSTDAFGNTNCSGPSGQSSRSSTDAFGNTNIQRSDGTSARVSRDAFGNTNRQESDGRSSRSSTDAFGNTNQQNSDGSSARMSRDAFGNTNIQRSDGSASRCSRDAFGNLNCN